MDVSKLKDGYEDFLSFRKEVEDRDMPDLTLDEINEIIRKARNDISLKEVAA